MLVTGSQLRFLSQNDTLKTLSIFLETVLKRSDRGSGGGGVEVDVVVDSKKFWEVRRRIKISSTYHLISQESTKMSNSSYIEPNYLPFLLFIKKNSKLKKILILD